VKVVVKNRWRCAGNKAVLQKCAHAVVQMAQDGHQIALVHGEALRSTDAEAAWQD